MSFCCNVLDFDRIEDGVRPLKDDEVKIFECSRQGMVANISLGSLIDMLESEDYITDQQKERIYAQPCKNDKIRELLDTIRRGSYKSLTGFIRSLRETDQEHVADILKKGGSKTLN